MVDLQNNKILLVMPQFFGYETQISGKLRSRGADVTFVGDRPSLSTLAKIATRISPGMMKPFADRHFRNIFGSIAADSFDYILIIKGESMSIAVTKEMFARFPSAKKIFYLWDSFKNSKGAFTKLSLFDEVLTFDPVDAKQTPGVRFRPLFYADSYLARHESMKPAIDVLFVGTAHTDRFPVLRKLREALPPGTRVYYYLFLASKLVFWGRKVLDPRLKHSGIADFKFVPLSGSENAALFQQAFAIADVERKVQRGLTMRTLEVLAAHKKLITTNAQVRDYDFYDSNNILVIDRNEPVVPADFFNTDFRAGDPSILQRYSLDGWIDDVFA